MNRDLLIQQLQEACDLEEKFISEFNDFFKKHVSDNHHLTGSEKEFVDKRIRILLIDSERHLGLFKSMLEKIRKNKYIVL